MKNNKFYTVNNVITKELINRGVLVEDTEGAYNGTITVDDIQYTLRAHWSNNFRCGIFGKTEAEATEIIRFFLDIVNNYEMKIITNIFARMAKIKMYIPSIITLLIPK
jgi:hypothetical protein